MSDHLTPLEDMRRERDEAQARADRAEQRLSEFGPGAQLPQRTVGDTEGNLHLFPRDVRDRLFEDRLENRGCRGHVGTENDDIVGLQAGEILECMKNGVVKNLDLSSERVGTVYLHGQVEVSRDRLHVLECRNPVLYALQKVRRSRSGDNRTVDGDAVRGQQQLELE